MTSGVFMKHPKTPPANPALVRARHALQLYSQEAFAAAYDDAARALGCRTSISVRQVRRWETASPPWPHPEARRVLEALFGCPVAMLGFVAPGTAPNGEPHDDCTRLFDEGPERLRRLMDLEADSLSIRSYEPQVVPGLLQSPNYALANAYMNKPTLTLTAAYERQRLRLERSQRLLSRDLPTSFIIPEVALQRPVGGLATMAEQLDHLLGIVTRYEHVRIQVLTTSAPIVESVPLYLLDMLPGRMVAWIEGRPGSVLMTSPNDTADLELIFDRLATVALDPAASLELVDRMRREACVAIETRL